MKTRCGLVLSFIIALPVQANENVVTIESTISGSQEQPKVLTIVPWQDAPEPDMVDWQVKSVVADEVMQPIDRQVFKRKSFYYHKLERQVWENTTETKP